MNRLPLNSGKIEDAGEFQWIHRPTVLIDLLHSQQLYVQLKSWTTNLKELLIGLGMQHFNQRCISNYCIFR